MLPLKARSKSSTTSLFVRGCIGLTYHSQYNYHCVKRRKDRPRDLRKIEDPVSSMDMAYLEPHVKKWKHWKWNYNSLTSQQYQKLKQIRDKKQRMYWKEERLPYWFDKHDPKLMKVIFIRDMDEFLAGETATIESGLYRNWLQPHKIAVPASFGNIKRWQHLNMDKRAERDRRIKMEQLSNDITQVRLEMTVRRDPVTDEVYSYITKQRICRKLLLLKRVTLDPQQVEIKKLAVSILTRSEDDTGTLERIDSAGSYTIELLLDEVYDYPFEFRLNVRYNDIERTNKTPYALEEEDDSIDDEEDEVKLKKIVSQELKSNLKQWQRAKHANQMLDHLVLKKSRYSELYEVSQLDLTKPQSQIES
eukprot:123475_1